MKHRTTTTPTIRGFGSCETMKTSTTMPILRGFCLDFEGTGKDRHAWIYAEESGDPARLAHLVQKFLKQFRPDQCWSLTYATTCSKPRIGEFGGGAVFVTADAIRWQSAYAFVEQQRATFEQSRTPHQEEANHGRTTPTDP